MHIDYRCGDSTCGVASAMAHCAVAVLPVVRTPQRRYLSGRYWLCRSLSLWVKCSQLSQCRRGVNTSIDSGKLSIKVVYLGKEVYDTPACSLV